jgi:hypothetical protein
MRIPRFGMQLEAGVKLDGGGIVVSIERFDRMKARE